MTDRPRNIANDILDCVETATTKWTRQKKSEERHPGNARYRASRMSREPRTTQKEAAWTVLEVDPYEYAEAMTDLLIKLIKKEPVETPIRHIYPRLIPAEVRRGELAPVA